MAMPMQNIEESLSVSYVSAVAAKAGASLDIPFRDFGVDVSIREISETVDDKGNISLVPMQVAFDCQLKSTKNWEDKDDKIVYAIDVKAYNKLIYRQNHSTTPCILVLLCLPKEKKDWLSITKDELILRKCCYYYIIKGDPTYNTSTITIRIPNQNLFTPDAVNDLIEKSKEGEI